MLAKYADQKNPVKPFEYQPSQGQKPMQVCTASLQKHLLPLDEQKYEKIKTNWRQIIPFF